MPGSRIPALTALSGANSANDDDVVIFDTSANTTKRISRSQLATGLVGDLPFTPTGSISATTLLTAVNELATESASLATAQTFTAQQTMTSGLVIQSVSPEALANIANAINTTAKVKGKIVYEDTNGRVYVATGASAANSWYRADGGGSIAPS